MVKIIPSLATLILIMSCASRTHDDAMRLFVEQMTMTVPGSKANIETFRKPRSGVALEGVQEVQSDMMGHVFVDRHLQ